MRAVFQDPAFRYGLKFGLAGVLAVFIALYIRLEEPTWALFTIFVLMIAQYVGAIAEKSFFRIIGTIVGGIIGYLLTASLEQQPVLFLTLTGLVVAFCTAMFGQSRYPYAFLLCGMTTVVVVSNGLGNPDFSWKYSLWRIEEVTLGILVAILVQSLIWPRYARVEFLANVHLAFADLQGCFQASSKAFYEGGSLEALRRAEDFPARISALRGLLDFGARESQYFRDRLSTYFEITNCLSRVASAIATLSKSLPAGSYYHAHLRAECENLHRCLDEALGDLAATESNPASRKKNREAIAEGFRKLGDSLVALRSDPALFEVPADVIIAFGLHLLALDEIRQQIERSHELLDSLPVMGDFSHREPPPFVSPFPPPFWIKSGIKSALAVVVALILDNWLQPPGAAMFVLGTWVFTSLNATSPGGRGDWRAFHYVVFNTILLIIVSVILLAIRPLLSSYAVMNTIIFTWLFAWGYLSFKVRGVTIPMQLAMLMIVGILGLNGQEAISFQAIVDYFFGLALALLVSSVIQRLLWPSLPQWELRDRFVEFLHMCRRVIQEGPQSLPLWQKTRIALIPGEADVRIGHLVPPICPAGEQERLRDYLTSLRRVGAQLVVAVGRLEPLLPKEHTENGKERIARLEAEMQKHLAAHETGMERAEPPAIDPSELTRLLEIWKEWMTELRVWMLQHDLPGLEVIRVVGLSGRYEEAGRDLLLANEQARRLRLRDYMGDYVL
ncbi:MAG: FUSC family protein [Terrimicrobiaceae bacterium]